MSLELIVLQRPEFGIYLRELRKNKNLTVKELANASNVSQSYLTNVENNKRGIPSPDILKRLHIHLDVDFMELMRYAGYVDNDTDLLILTLDRLHEVIYEIENVLWLNDDTFPEECIEDIKNIMFDSRWYFYNATRKMALNNEDKEALTALFSFPKKPSNDFDKETFFNNVVQVTPEFFFGTLKLEEFSDPEDPHTELVNILTRIAEVAIAYESGQNEFLLNFLRDQKVCVDLEEFLDKRSIRYEGKKLSESDRQSILEMLKLLFRDRQ
jgi:transcriptional regulator with XRE-family HTH domain